MAIASDKAKRLVNNFRRATIDHAFKGSSRPEEREDIEMGYQIARKILLNYIAVLEHDYAEVTHAIARAVK